jgi:DNA-binding XRE family transcriptional regulator
MAERANVYPLRREPTREPQAPPQQAPSRQLPPQRATREPQRVTREPQEPLWREVLGQRLRALRQNQQETLTQTATRAGISPQYLSEIERGRKEPSSEMIAALAGALGTTLTGLTEQVADDLRRQQAIAQSRTAPAPATLACVPQSTPSAPVMLSLAA